MNSILKDTLDSDQKQETFTHCVFVKITTFTDHNQINENVSLPK